MTSYQLSRIESREPDKLLDELERNFRTGAAMMDENSLYQLHLSLDRACICALRDVLARRKVVDDQFSQSAALNQQMRDNRARYHAGLAAAQVARDRADRQERSAVRLYLWGLCFAAVVVPSLMDLARFVLGVL